MGAAGAVAADVVDRRHGASGGGQVADRADRLVGVPRPRIVPVDQPGVRAVVDQRQRGVVAAAVEVVETQHRQTGGGREPRLARRRRVRPARRRGPRAEGGAPRILPGAGTGRTRPRTGRTVFPDSPAAAATSFGYCLMAPRSRDRPHPRPGDVHARVVPPAPRHTPRRAARVRARRHRHGPDLAPERLGRPADAAAASATTDRGQADHGEGRPSPVRGPRLLPELAVTAAAPARSGSGTPARRGPTCSPTDAAPDFTRLDQVVRPRTPTTPR